MSLDERPMRDSDDNGSVPREFVRRFTKDFRIPVLGRIFRGINNFIHVNRNITGLIVWNQEIEKRTESLEFRIENFELRIESLESRLENLETKLENIQTQMEEIHAWQLPDRTCLLERTIQDYNDVLDRHEEMLNTEFKEAQKLLQTMVVELSNMKADITDIYQMHEQSTLGKNVREDTLTVSEIPSDEYFSIDYFDFENRFRGSRESIKNSQTIYVPYFADRKQVVDLGCGRGEFVELLMEHGIGVRGVDMYTPFVEYCKMMHLPVQQGDMIHFLRQQDSVDGIFLGQVVEHITTEQIIELCMVAYEKLEDGCYLIMETQNPGSLAIYTNAFWVDPSHKKPVHPLTLQYIAEKQGFSDVQIIYTESSRAPYEIPRLSDKEEGREHEFDIAMQRVSNLLYGSQDYAVLARK